MTRALRRGVTLVEALLALTVAAILVGVVMGLLTSASRLFATGQEVLHGRDAALLFLDRLEQDLAGAVQIPGDPRPPLRVGEDGALAFYVADFDLDGAFPIEGRPVLWEFQEHPSGLGLTPTRNGEAFGRLVLGSVAMELLAPNPEEDRTGWHLLVRVGFEGSVDRAVVRAIRLIQPSANFLHFPDHGAGLMAGMVTIPPSEDPRFQGLGAPDDAPAPDTDPDAGAKEAP